MNVPSGNYSIHHQSQAPPICSATEPKTGYLQGIVILKTAWHLLWNGKACSHRIMVRAMLLIRYRSFSQALVNWRQLIIGEQLQIRCFLFGLLMTFRVEHVVDRDPLMMATRRALHQFGAGHGWFEVHFVHQYARIEWHSRSLNLLIGDFRFSYTRMQLQWIDLIIQ